MSFDWTFALAAKSSVPGSIVICMSVIAGILAVVFPCCGREINEMRDGHSPITGAFALSGQFEDTGIHQRRTSNSSRDETEVYTPDEPLCYRLAER
jgi:hypothetical protein